MKGVVSTFVAVVASVALTAIGPVLASAPQTSLGPKATAEEVQTYDEGAVHRGCCRIRHE